MGIRSISVEKGGRRMATACADHSIRLWDFNTRKCNAILAGHHDVAVGASFLNADTLVSCSWDMRIMIWKI